MAENILSKIKHEKLIDDTMNKFTPQFQCPYGSYSVAIGIVVHLAQSRILKRKEESFKLIKDEIYQIFGGKEDQIKTVLDSICPKYKLNYKLITENEAKIVVNKSRPQIFTFALNETQWILFSEYFKNNPWGILKKEYLVENKKLNWWDKITSKLKSTNDNQKIIDMHWHSVLLWKCEEDHLLMMNSWGENFADRGFFRIENTDTLRFSYPTYLYDVYSNFDMLNMLIPKNVSNKNTAVLEKCIYLNKRLENIEKNHGIKIRTEYTCPLCNRKSSTIEILCNSRECTNTKIEYSSSLSKNMSKTGKNFKFFKGFINLINTNTQNSEFSLEMPQISLDHLEIIIVD